MKTQSVKGHVAKHRATSADSSVFSPRDVFSPARGWLSASLATAILFLGLAAAATTARIVYRTYSPTIVMDQWGVVDDLMRAGGDFLPISTLWAQQNEHRIVVGRLACLADLHFFGGRNVSLLVEIFLVQVVSAILFLWMFHHFRKATIAASEECPICLLGSTG